LELSGYEIDTGTELSDLAGKFKYPSGLGDGSVAAAVCSPRKDKGRGCHILLTTSDEAVALIFHPGKILWVREEALASIAAVESLDLPVSDTDAAIEKEFDHKESEYGNAMYLNLSPTILYGCCYYEVTFSRLMKVCKVLYMWEIVKDVCYGLCITLPFHVMYSFWNDRF
jgi:hypothetical protein